MAERDSVFVPGAQVDVEEARVGIGALLTPATSAIKARTGLRPSSGSPGLVTATGTPDGSVHVAPFQAFLQSTRGAVQGGTYILTSDQIKDINILSTPAHASLGRLDLIIAHQSDTTYSDADSQMRVRQIVGTPSGSPADPSLASYPDSLTLARVQVDAAVTTITSGKITDLRPSWTVGLGGVLPIANQTVRDALTGLYDGYTIYRQDRDWRETYDGAGWRVIGIPIVSSSADLSAVTSPYSGQVAHNTGTGYHHRYTGSAWTGSLGQYVGETLVTSGDIAQAAGNNAILISHTFTAHSGMRYDVFFESTFSFQTGNVARVQLRHASGGSVTTSSTAVGAREIGPVNTSQHTPLTFRRTFVAAASGTYTVGISSNFFSGANNLYWGSNVNSEMVLRVATA